MLVHHFNELPGGSALTRSLELTYGDNGVDGFTFLKEAVLKGYIKKADGVYTTKAYPPFSFDYQQHDWNTTVKAITEDNLVHAPSGIDQKNYHFVDLYNEGLSGILSEQNTGWFYKNNLGDGNFGQAQLIASRPSFNGMNQKVQIMDLEANGVKQLVQWDDEPQGYFELSPEEQWQPFRSFEKKVSINKRDAHVRMLDLNGDGLADLLITEHNVFARKAKRALTQARKSIIRLTRKKDLRSLRMILFKAFSLPIWMAMD
jgi:hypothetical protein